MKTYQRLLMFILGCVFTLAMFTACEWDTSDEPDHPTYVTYTITAEAATFEGPSALFDDIKTWVRSNHKVYDVKMSYSTGDASEFTKTDSEAIKHFEVFAPKFKAYLEQEVTAKLKNGDYKPDDPDETDVTVKAVFHVYAMRTQGEGGNLMYQDVKFSY